MGFIDVGYDLLQKLFSESEEEKKKEYAQQLVRKVLRKIILIWENEPILEYGYDLKKEKLKLREQAESLQGLASDVDGYVEENIVNYLMQLSNKLKSLEPVFVPADRNYYIKFKEKIDEVVNEIKSKIWEISYW
mgnify:CR=1 FL=1